MVETSSFPQDAFTTPRTRLTHPPEFREAKLVRKKQWGRVGGELLILA